jgi:sulfate permease, SulP family
VVVAGIVVVAQGDLADHGVDVIGEIDGAVPVPALPSVGWDELLALLPGALAIAVIGYAETATVGESLANGHCYTIQPDRELPATGLANVLAGLFQGSSPAAGPASRPPTTAPAPRPSWCRCWCRR